MFRGEFARWLNFVLGAWLCVSVLVWKHSPVQYNNGWMVGLATATVAALAMRVPAVRYANSVIAVWLFVSAWALPSASDLTIWNSVMVSIAIYLAATSSSEPPRLPRHALAARRT